MNQKSETKVTKKGIVLSILVIGIIAAVFAAYQVYHYLYPTCYPYNERFILGNTVENIVEKYGEFDMRYDEDKEIPDGAYLVESGTESETKNWVYYRIRFEDGVAAEASIYEQYGAG